MALDGCWPGPNQRRVDSPTSDASDREAGEAVERFFSRLIAQAQRELARHRARAVRAWAKRNSPCRPCCDCCCSDACADVLDLLTEDDGVSETDYDFTGTWEYTEGLGEKAETADAFATAIHHAELTTNQVGYVADLYFTLDADRKSSRLILGWLDDDNYYFVECSDSDDTQDFVIRIGERIGGTEAVRETICVFAGLAAVTTTSATATVRAVLKESHLYVDALCRSNQLLWSDAFASWHGTVTATGGTRAGFGSGDSGAVIAPQIKLGRFHSCCQGQRFCSACCDDTTPDEVQVEFDGVANGTETDSATFNDTAFILARVAPCDTAAEIGNNGAGVHGSGACGYQLLTGLPAGITQLTAGYSLFGSPTVHFRPGVGVANASTIDAANGDVVVQCAGNCAQPYEFSAADIGIPEYDFSNATIRITPL